MLKYTVAMLACALLAQHAQAQSPNSTFTVTQSFNPFGYVYDVTFSMPPGWSVDHFAVIVERQVYGGGYAYSHSLYSVQNPTSPSQGIDTLGTAGYYRAQVKFWINTGMGTTVFYSNYAYWIWAP